MVKISPKPCHICGVDILAFNRMREAFEVVLDEYKSDCLELYPHVDFELLPEVVNARKVLEEIKK